jgi:ornithine decarboxylase
MNEMDKVINLARASVRRAEREGRNARITGTPEDVVAALRPAKPLYILWPKRIAVTAKHFMKAFPGQSMYAVKTNPDENVIRALSGAGMRNFDAASLDEIRLVRRVAPKARIFFMHPVKAPEAIREAYALHGVRDFVLDTQDELFKILRETDLAGDICLYVRLGLPKNGKAAIDFSSKFGCSPKEAVKLLRACRPASQKIGLCFHVGTQTTDPAVFARAVGVAATVIRESGVQVDVLDVGGGYPVSYPGNTVAPVETYIDAMRDALQAEGLGRMPLLAEPGRALVAASGALIARVELRKGNTLYLNDGTYGGLFDAGPVLKTRFPVMAHRPESTFEGELKAFRFAGPTCDSLDMMEGPFMLPADIKMGDWIEIGNLGAYSRSMRTDFNGFGASDVVCLYDKKA